MSDFIMRKPRDSFDFNTFIQKNSSIFIIDKNNTEYEVSEFQFKPDRFITDEDALVYVKDVIGYRLY
jgi:hypothetical protein